MACKKKSVGDYDAVSLTILGSCYYGMGQWNFWTGILKAALVS